MSLRKSVEYFFFVAVLVDISSKNNRKSAWSFLHQVTARSSKKSSVFARSLLQCCSIGKATRQDGASTGAAFARFASHSLRSRGVKHAAERPWTTLVGCPPPGGGAPPPVGRRPATAQDRGQPLRVAHRWHGQRRRPPAPTLFDPLHLNRRLWVGSARVGRSGHAGGRAKPTHGGNGGR
jgi:hypothetical protein